MTDEERQEVLMNDFLRVPNIILQMQRVLKNGNTYACLQFIWAKTGGWNQNEDTIAYSQFINDKRYGTGLSDKTIRRSVEKLAELGVINMRPSFNNMHEFSINIYKIKELIGEQARSNRPPLEDASMVNLSVSPVNLSASMVNLSGKHGQSDHHTRTTTQEPLHKTITQDANPPTEKAKPNPPAKKKATIEKPSELSQQIWDDLITLRKSKRAPLSQTAWTPIANQIVEIQQQTGHSLDDIVTVWVTRAWTAIKAEWYFNHISSNQSQQTNNQGNTYANHQSANQINQQQPKQSSADAYADSLDAAAAAYFASQSQ